MAYTLKQMARLVEPPLTVHALGQAIRRGTLAATLLMLPIGARGLYLVDEPEAGRYMDGVRARRARKGT